MNFREHGDAGIVVRSPMKRSAVSSSLNYAFKSQLVTVTFAQGPDQTFSYRTGLRFGEATNTNHAGPARKPFQRQKFKGVGLGWFYAAKLGIWNETHTEQSEDQPLFSR